MLTGLSANQQEAEHSQILSVPVSVPEVWKVNVAVGLLAVAGTTFTPRCSVLRSAVYTTSKQ